VCWVNVLCVRAYFDNSLLWHVRKGWQPCSFHCCLSVHASLLSPRLCLESDPPVFSVLQGSWSSAAVVLCPAEWPSLEQRCWMMHAVHRIRKDCSVLVVELWGKWLMVSTLLWKKSLVSTLLWKMLHKLDEEMHGAHVVWFFRHDDSDKQFAS
jgi:hypothetical protein